MPTIPIDLVVKKWTFNQENESIKDFIERKVNSFMLNHMQVRKTIYLG